MLSKFRRITVLSLTVMLLVALGTVGNISVGTPAEAASAPACRISSGYYYPVWAGEQRVYRVVVPAGANANTPVYVSIHGAGQTTETHQQVSGMSYLADTGQAIVVYPQSKIVGVLGNNIWRVTPGSQDLKYVEWVVGNLHQNSCGSSQTTAVSGFSMGAMIVSQLLCERSDLFHSAAMIAGALPPTPGCSIPSNMSVLVQHGTADPILDWGGGIPQQWVRDSIGASWQQVDSPGVPRDEIARRWQQAKGCPASENGWSGGVAGVARIDYTTCGTAPTILIGVFGGSHEWDPYRGNNPSNGTTRNEIVNLAAQNGYGKHAASAGSVTTVHVAGTPGRTALLNITAVSPSRNGWAVIYPCNVSRPPTSSVNFNAGSIVANFVAARSDGNGNVCVYSTVATHLIVDQVGSIEGASGFPGPARIVDTRNTGGKPQAGEARRIHTSIPNMLVVGNLTVTGADTRGYLSAYSCDTTRANTSVVNYIPGTNAAAGVAVRTDSTGDFCVYASESTHIIFDQYDAVASQKQSGFVRVADTRIGGLPAGANPLIVQTGMIAGSTVVATVTVVGRGIPGHTSVGACEAGKPPTSVNNYSGWGVSANLTVTQVGQGGTICVWAPSKPDIIVDVQTDTKWSLLTAQKSSTRLLDTRF